MISLINLTFYSKTFYFLSVLRPICLYITIKCKESIFMFFVGKIILKHFDRQFSREGFPQVFLLKEGMEDRL